MKRIIAYITLIDEESYNLPGLAIAFGAGCVTAVICCHFLM
jgi:hypothetical protein